MSDRPVARKFRVYKVVMDGGTPAVWALVPPDGRNAVMFSTFEKAIGYLDAWLYLHRVTQTVGRGEARR